MLQPCPCLRPDAQLRIANHGVEIELTDAVFSVSGLPEVPLLQAIMSMNGLLDVAAIARQSGLSPHAVQIVVRRLEQVELLGYVSPMTGDAFSPDSFNTLCASLYRQWKARLFAHPLWTGMAQGSLPRSVFIGWVVESWWFVTGIQERLPMAIACCEDPTLRAMFARHFAQEWDHFRYFERALDELEVTLEERKRSLPLPATRALLHLMRAAARVDPLRYAVCSGFLESTSSDRADARAFFDRVAIRYGGADQACVRPMAEHLALDEEYGHEGVVRRVTRAVGPIERARACSALRDAFALVETLEMWSTDILRHYQSSAAFPLCAQRSYRGVRK
ncbi:hypothetical protein [Massilia horti]|uniref:Thiaminase-2/PQQC domain-containing protein n=1 Tax=Massilia horti TaxID=2562153 RepID=A0A4Y9T362_9BURK|nr:hypothetical protein [Massilia horti]TFW33644.1 hypothetical protein E4O92_06530 [Massilia horti]